MADFNQDGFQDIFMTSTDIPNEVQNDGHGSKLLLGSKQTKIKSKIISSKNLLIPHPKIQERNFVLTPLLSLNPKIKIPGIKKNIIDLSTSIENHIPLWMGIIS